MAKFSGLFELKTPQDLFKKLQHDFTRLNQKHLDTYAAFDFFVTAEHMLDWLFPNDEPKRKAKRQSSVLLQTCSHIANGAKHFEVTKKHHTSVQGTESVPGDFDPNDFGDDFATGGLKITLDGNAIAEFGNKIFADQLAEMVLAYWKSELGL